MTPRTRDVIGWHWSVGDLVALAQLAAAGALLVALDHAAQRLERWMDAHA